MGVNVWRVAIACLKRLASVACHLSSSTFPCCCRQPGHAWPVKCGMHGLSSVHYLLTAVLSDAKPGVEGS